MEEIISHWPTQNQNSVYESSPLLELYLDLWDRNRFFTNVLLKCWIARVTKNLDKLPCTKALPQAPSPFSQPSPLFIHQGCWTTASGNYLCFDVTTTLCYPFYLFEFISYTSQVHTLSSKHPSRYQKPLKHPVDNIKINLQSPHKNLRNHQNHSNNPHAPHALIYHCNNIPFTRVIG